MTDGLKLTLLLEGVQELTASVATAASEIRLALGRSAENLAETERVLADLAGCLADLQALVEPKS